MRLSSWTSPRRDRREQLPTYSFSQSLVRLGVGGFFKKTLDKDRAAQSFGAPLFLKTERGIKPESSSGGLEALDVQALERMLLVHFLVILALHTVYLILCLRFNVSQKR